MVEEVAVLLVVAGVAELLVTPEEDHAEVVVEAQTAAERRQIGTPVGFLKNLETKSVPRFLSVKIKILYYTKIGEKC